MPVAPELILRNRPAGRIRPRLDRLRDVLDELGNPQEDFKSVLIVGTNGKGSTAAILDAVLRNHGVVTGLYTSPHLVRVEERIRFQGAEVSTDDLARVLGELDRFDDLTFFEMLTAAAFVLFAEAGVHIAVLEAGMGGTWDATRLADSQVAGLTNVGSDHTAWLGQERAARARDKGRALAAAQWAVVGRAVDDDDVAAVSVPGAFSAESLVCCEAIDRSRVRIGWTGTEAVVEVPFAGIHQRDNLQLALALAQCSATAGWVSELEMSKVERALADVRWPGRLSIHRIAGREVLLDCAHNFEAARALADHLERAERRYNLVFSCLDDKPVEEMAALLRPRVDRVAICRLDDERAMAIDRLAAAFPDAVVAEDPLACLEKLPDPVLGAGSIRVVGALLAAGG